MTIRIPVKTIDWELIEGRFTPPLPEPDSIKVLDDSQKYIELVPYGSTELRLTVFPVIR